MVAENDSLPISLVLHTVFCPRRTWLEINGENTDTYQMQAGHSAHRKVDDPKTSRSEQIRSLDVRSSTMGIHGRIDVIENKNDSVRIVEYKATPVKLKPIVTEANKVQLALQQICLEESGFEVDQAAVRFVDHNKNVIVEIDDATKQHAISIVRDTREIISASEAPLPLEDDKRCSRCSHIDVCLPDERRGEPIARRINASDPDGQVLHLTEQGSRASTRAGRLIVSRQGEKSGEVPLERVHGVVVHGNIDLSGALIRELLWRNQAIVWCSSTGRVYGWSQPTDGPNGLSRTHQRVIFGDGGLEIAKEMVSAKIHNQATMLRRNRKHAIEVESIRSRAQEVRDSSSKEEIFGIEGESASVYFSEFDTMLKESAMEQYGFEWNGRSGRGATDPINILLNYSYSLLTSECIRALLSCGLDPHAGVLHSSNRNKPALALDLMEEFRPLIADSVVISLINRKEFPKSGFSKVGGGLKLSPAGRKALIKSFEARIQTQITHPIFGYKVTWRRAIEVQARMVLGVIDGSQAEYKGVKTR